MLIYATILLFTALYNDYADEDMPDEDVPCDEDIPDAVPAEERSAPPSPTSRSESPANEAAHADSPSLVPSQSCPLPRKPARFGRRSPPLVNVTQIMRLAGGLGPGLAAAISHANTLTDSFGTDWQVPSERAGGDSRRIANKRKAGDITRSAAEDFALLTCRTTSEHHAVDFLATVTNVIHLILITLVCLILSNYCVYHQPSYRPTDVPYRTLRALGSTVKKAMLGPEADVQTASMNEGDGVYSMSHDHTKLNHD